MTDVAARRDATSFSVRRSAWPMLLSAAGLAPGAADAQQAYTGILEEIIVTARRREENLQDLPLSIASLSADALRTNGIYYLDTIDEFVPNLKIEPDSRANSTEIRIRGVGGGNPDPIFPFGTGLYIDGHYVPHSTGAFMSTLDIERVEVLRGPQGTLFGKNTTGGAVNIVSARPSPEFASSLDLRAGEFGQRDARGMLNFGVSDRVSARIAGAVERDDGYYYNRNLDVWTNGGDLRALTGSLRFLPDEHWTIDTTLSVSQQRDDNYGGQCATGDGNIDAWGGARFYGDPGSVMYRAQCDADAALGPFITSSDKLTYSNVDQEGVFASARWNAGESVGPLDDASVSILASYRRISYEYIQDRDFTPFRIDAIGTVGDDADTNVTRNLEILFEGVVNDRVDFLIGANFFDDEALTGRNDCYTQWVSAHDLVLDNDVICSPQVGVFFELAPDKVEVLGRPFTAGPPTVFKNGSVWNESLGVFGHLTYSLNASWDLDLGARYTRDTREFNNIEFHISNYQRTNDLGFGSFDTIMNNLTVIESGFFNTGESTFSEVTPMASLTRHLDSGTRLDSGMIYFLYSEGFLTGGFNNELNIGESNPAADLLQPFATYDPEHLDNYEFGFKGTFVDGRMQLNSAIYFMDYSDIQSQFGLDNSQGQFGGGDEVIGIVANVADAEIYGVELELRARLWPGGSATFDFGYNHFQTSEYTFFDEAALRQGEFRLIDISGDGDEDWTINASLQHRFNLPNGAGLTAMLGAYRESADPFFGPLSGPGRAFEYCQRKHDYTKWRARLGYEPADGGYQISLFGDNITDELIYELCGGGRGAYGYRYERPAAWGLEFSARWGGSR